MSRAWIAWKLLVILYGCAIVWAFWVTYHG